MYFWHRNCFQVRRSLSIGFSLVLAFISQGRLFGNAITPVDVAKAAILANKLFAESSHSVILESDLLVSGDSIFLNLQGTHYLYSYLPQRGTFIRQDQSHFHGHNFDRYLFMYKGEIYAFGGYGFWQSHSRLIKFDFTSHEWQLVPLIGAKIPGDPIFNFLKGDTLYSIGITVRHDIQNQKEIRNNFYKIDLKQFLVTEFEYEPNHEFDIPRGFGFLSFGTDYFVQGSHSSIALIFDYKRNKIYRNLSGPRLFRQPQFNREAKDSVMHFVVGNEVVTVLWDKIVERVNLEDYIKYYCVPLAGLSDRIIEPESTDSNRKFLWVGIVLFCLSIGLLIFLYVRGKGPFNKRILNYYLELNTEEVVLKMLKGLPPDTYTEKEIDILFRIYHFPSSVRKIKRNQYIFSLNEISPGVIEKNTHPSNKSQFVYKVNATQVV